MFECVVYVTVVAYDAPLLNRRTGQDWQSVSSNRYRCSYPHTTSVETDSVTNEILVQGASHKGLTDVGECLTDTVSDRGNC